METFPDIFPKPNIDFSTEAAPNAIRTQMDSGTIRTRRRFTTEMLTAQISWEFDDIQLGVFNAFVKNYLNGGVDWFIIDLPLGDGMHPHEIRFVDGKYSVQYIPVSYWRVSAVVDIKERHVMSDLAMQVYIDTGLDENSLLAFIEAVENARIITQVTLPEILNP